jgi:glucose-6-phosphate dehydrogenase assembly protein OpcA
MSSAAVVRPEKLLKDLAAEWTQLGKAETEGSARSAGVLRAVTMTMLVGVEAGEDERLALEALSQLMHEHPARAIILRLAPEEKESLSGRAYATCWMPFGRRSQICCEQIELSAGASSFSEIPRLLRGLIAPDLPVVFWCRSPKVFAHASYQPIAALADKIILDSRAHPDPDATVRAIDQQLHEGCLIGDITWTRLTRWRQTISAAFERADCRAFFDSLTKVEIFYTHQPEPIAARYLRAWLQSILGAKFPVALTHSPEDESFSWQIRQVRFSCPESNVTIERPEKGMAQIHVENFHASALFESINEAELLRDEISILGRDPVFAKAAHLLSLSHS